MMGATFTPGPWQELPSDVSIDDNVGFADDAVAQRISTWCALGNPEFGDPIVAFAVFCGEHDDPEFDANIRLIAAAPDLYAALEKAAPFIGWASTRGQIIAGVDSISLCDEIAAVLAKAQGGPA